MSVESFEKICLFKNIPSYLTLEFRLRTDFAFDISLPRDPKELKVIYKETLEDMRTKLLLEFDKALLELERVK